MLFFPSMSLDFSRSSDDWMQHTYLNFIEQTQLSQNTVVPINTVLKIYMYLPEEVLPYVLETVKKAKKRVSECTIKWFVKLNPILEDKVGAVFTLPETGLFSLHTAHYC